MTDQQAVVAKTLDMVESCLEKMWDAGLKNLANFAWSQEQIENMARKQLDQNKAAREELLKVTEQVVKQVRANQEVGTKMMADAVQEAYQYMNQANNSLMGDLPQRVEEMVKKAGWPAPLFGLKKAV
jgi:hypothetical protein